MAAWLAVLVVVAACLGLLGRLWARDYARLANGGAPPVLWPFSRLARAVEARHQAALDEAVRRAGQSSTERAILDCLPDPVLVLDHDRALRYANPAARAAIGGEIAAVLRHPTLRGAIDRAQAARLAVESVDLLLPVPVPRDLHTTVIDLGQERDEARTALVFAERTRARAVERMRADFVANASHELRTPLASLIGFIETLVGPAADDPPAQRRFLGIMAEQAQRMNRLIDDLLSLSRIELSEHLAPSERLDLAALVARSVMSFEPRMRAAGATLRQRIAPGLAPVLADADQMEQVLQNLLDNALKYGKPGGVVEIALDPAGSMTGSWPARPGVVLAVRDEGPGIARAHLPRLTERFYRVERGRSRAAGGTGLGLAIVKHIVNRHRGQLLIDSRDGEGSKFSIWLPVVE